MAGGSLLTLLDDIASLLDDVATMSKLATRKTAGVLSDDLALNAEQVSGVRASRELPVIWSVAKGSAINKLLLIPAALLMNYFLPWLTIVLLVIGGAYLCFEGVEKILHSYHAKKTKKAMTTDNVKTPTPSITVDEAIAMEKAKIRGAIRTDFILSAEIIVIALNVVENKTLLVQTLTLLAIAAFITIGVYGLVAAIVKLDDIGYWMVRLCDKQGIRYKIGTTLINAAPYLMRFLSIVGTIAMFLVGGGLIQHNINYLHQIELNIASWYASWPQGKEILNAITPSLFNLVVGIIVGCIVLLAVNSIKKIIGAQQKHN